MSIRDPGSGDRIRNPNRDLVEPESDHCYLRPTRGDLFFFGTSLVTRHGIKPRGPLGVAEPWVEPCARALDRFAHIVP